jgi:enoyl-CoA hydratase/carnithine racemase
MLDNVLVHEENRGIHRLVMDHGPNALDHPLMSALRNRLGQLVNDGAPAVVLASSHPTLFCPGWNLKLLAGADREEVGEFLHAFNGLILDLFSYPGPTAAAIGGHSVAGGCLMSLCCDLRVMATGQARQGLSELNLGVPVPFTSLRMLRARLSSPALDDLVFRGEGCTATRARELGIVHRTAADADTLAVTELELGKLAGRPRRAFVESKRYLFAEVWELMRRGSPSEDAAFLDCWFEEETKERIAGVASHLSH